MLKLKNKNNHKNLIIMLIVSVLSALILFTGKINADNSYMEFKPFKFAFVPDIKFSYERQNTHILYSLSQIAFQDAIKLINNDKNTDFVVFGGDMLSNSESNYSDLYQFIDLADSLEHPYYLIFGDREARLTDDYSKEYFTSEFKRKVFTSSGRSYWKHEPVKDVVIIGLDSSQVNKEQGLIDNEQMGWLKSTLEENKNKFTVVFLHHLPKPLDEDLSVSEFKKFSIVNSGEFIKLISCYPQVKLVVNGSRYVNSVRKINNTVYVSTPSISVYPNIFNFFRVYPDRVEIENKKIGYKQIIKLAKKNLVNSDMAKIYDSKKTKNIIKLHEGDEYSKLGKYYF